MSKPTSIQVLTAVPFLPRRIREGPGVFSDLVGSSSSAAAPIVCGVWDADDVKGGTDAFTAEWDEMKYVLSGESVWEDARSGQRFEAKAGSLIWFPKGSRTALASSKNLSTIYVESTYRRTIPVADLQIDWMENLDILHETMTQTYIAANPNSKANHEEALKYMPGGNTRSVLHYYPFPLSIRSGRGCRVTSLDGHEYLDFVSEYSAALFGHSHPVITEAVQNAATNRGYNLGGLSTDEVTLARHIVGRFKSIDKVRFTNSGTEANTMALAVALAYTGRKKILVFSNGYHGAFAQFGAAGGHSNPLNIPHDFLIGQYNEIAPNNHFITEELAAILVEPMQGAGGMIPATAEFLKYVRAAATRTGAVLIFDEIITSRFHMGGMQEYHGIYPDMTTVGKYLGGGFSFGAFGGRAEIMMLLDAATGKLFHSGTHNNNTFSMAAGVAAAEILTPEAIDHTNKLGDQLRDGINEIVNAAGVGLGMAMHATGFGSSIGIRYSGPFPERLRDTFFFFLLNRGIYIGKRGFLSLNLMHEGKDVEYVLLVVKEFVQRLQGSWLE